MKFPLLLRALIVLIGVTSLHAQPELEVFPFVGKPGQAFNTPTDGVGAAAAFSLPSAIAVARSGDIYIGDTYNQRVCKVTPAGVVTTLASGGTSGGLLKNPIGLAIDEATSELYVADWGSAAILKISPQGAVSLVAGARVNGYLDGDGDIARFNYPRGVAVLGDYLYVTDSLNHVIRRIHKGTRVVTTFAGAGGTSGLASGLASLARFNQPWAIAVDPTAIGGGLVISDWANGAIRRLSVGGFAGIVATGLAQPEGVAVDASGVIYVS
ncbi:MAG TPA: hypothetical protein VGE76_19925, partial [Opitutaceae bacterium]